MIHKKYPFLLFIFFLLVEFAAAQELIGPHGYLTFEAEIGNKDSVSRRGTFDLHHFNLLGNYLINPQARVFGEIEWEHGADTEEEEAGRSFGIVRIERAWFEYAFLTKFKLRFGKFLTPYGIYNEIHDAAPAFDTSILPRSIYGQHENPFGDSQKFYSKFSLGVQALGTFDYHGAQFKYQIFLANGRGDNAFEQDDNSDKAFGLRIQSDIPGMGLKLGYSFYTGKNGLAENTRQTSHAWDLRFEFNKLRISGEYAHSILDNGNTAARGLRANAIYGEIAYHIFGRQTLLVRYDIFDSDRQISNDLEKDFTIATSLQIIHQVVAKAEVHFWYVENAPRTNYILAIASLAVIF